MAGSGDSREQRTLLRAFVEAARAKATRDVEEERARAEVLRERVIPTVAAAIEKARLRRLCGRAWLFGSFAWGSPGDRSDVDLLVEEAKDPDLLASVVGEGSGREVHVVTRETAPESLVLRVLAEGHAL